MGNQPPAVPVSPQGRKPTISREDIIAATLKLLGPNRSVSTLSLREIAREAGIAPNSIYRHFRNLDELAVALIDLAGESLRQIIVEARERANSDQSVVQGCTDAFMEQLRADNRLLHIFLREGTVGSDAYKRAVERQLNFFEDELQRDMRRLAKFKKSGLHEPRLTAKAITRLVFTLGATALDMPENKRTELSQQIVMMVRIILAGTQALAMIKTKDLT